MKKKLTLYPRIKKEFFKGFSRIKWVLLTNLIYFYRNLFNKKSRIVNKISILIPSKQRVKKLKRCIDSMFINTNNLERIQVLILIDENEINKQDYISYINSLSNDINIKLFIKNEKTHNLRNNFLASKVISDLYFPLNDDVIFTMKGWDSYIDEIASIIPHNKPFSIWTKASSKYPYLHSEFPIVNYEWYQKLGYIGNLYLYGYIDTWICDLGKISKKFIVAKKKFIEHLNAEIEGLNNEKDNTYNELMISQIGDKEKWLETKNIRKKDSMKLL